MFEHFLSHGSKYLAFIAWGATGFMAQPTFASFVTHFAIVPVVLWVTLIVAKHEGRRLERDSGLDRLANEKNEELAA